MKFTAWTVGLVLLAALVFYIRRVRERRSDRREREMKANRNKDSRAKADRLAILDLAKNLTASAPSEEGVAPTEPKAPAADRFRRSSESPHGFDPDLPVPRG